MRNSARRRSTPSTGIAATTAARSGVHTATEAAKARLKPVPPGSYSSGAIIMLTDGRRTTGPDPLDVADLAADLGVTDRTIRNRRVSLTARLAQVAAVDAAVKAQQAYETPAVKSMLHSLADPVQVIDPDIADTRPIRSYINKNKRHITECGILE